MVHEFKTFEAFLKACNRGDVPVNLVSPGYVARQKGLHRSTVHQAIARGRLDAWRISGGYVLVCVDDVDIFDRR